MKRILIAVLSLIPLFAMAQEPQIIGGYLLDGKDSFEELEAVILTESKSKEKNLGCKASLRIYRMDSEDNLMNIVTMPIYQDIPKATEQTTFSIAPEDRALSENAVILGFTL